MKNISITLLFILAICTYKVNAQGGANCATASSTPVTLPFSATNQTTCGMGNVYNGANSVVCGNSVYMDGEDILYAFTPTVSGLININITSGSSWVGLFLYQGCPSGGICVANSTSSSGNQSLNGIFVAAGITYYVVVDKWSSPTCITSFNINISAPIPAPTPTVQDCLGSIAVCQNVYSEANAYSGTGNIPNEINSGPSCLDSGEKNDVWYTFTTQTVGNVCFTINPNVNSDDYDWAVYNLTSNSCSDIYSNAALEVSCNYSGLSGNTGPNGLPGDQNNPCIPVQVGETYVVNVSQYSSSTNGYIIDFGASTASIFDNVSPSLQAINSTITCGMSSLAFNFTENVTCSGTSSSNFTLTGPGGPYTLSSLSGFNCANGASQDRFFSIAVTPAITEPGTYFFCVIDSSVADLCNNYTTAGCLTFDVIYPTASALVNDTITCSAPVVTLSGSGSSVGNYNWFSIGGSIVSGQNTLTPQVNQTGFYVIEVNTNDCISRDTVEVFQDASLPIVIAGNDTSITCLVDTIQLSGFISGSNIVSYWTGPSIISGDSTLNPLINTAGTYVLTATDTVNGCQLSSTVNVVDDKNLPFIDAGINANLTCVAGTIVLDGTGSVSGSEYAYQWTDSNGVVIADSIFASTTISGIFTLTVWNTTNNCSASDFITIGIDTILPVANAGADTSLNCVTLTGVPINGQNIGPTPNYTYDWSTPNGNILFENNESALVNLPGTYIFSVTNNTNGCINTDDLIVAIDTAKPTANAGPDMIRNCYNPTVNLDGTNSSPSANITYLWSGSSTITNGNTATPTISGSGTGNYTLTVTNTTNGCTDTDTASVSSNFTSPGANTGTLDTLCSGNDLTLNGTSTSGNILVWTTTDGNIVSGDSTLTPTINEGGTYTLTTTNTTSGCTSTSSIFIQEIFVSAIISANPTTGMIPLTVDFVNLGIADSSYWNFANNQTFGDTSTTSSPTVIYDTQGSFVVSLISYVGECSAQTQITIEVIGTSFLIVPNVFTPNGDGSNDVFKFIYQNITELNCVIFNRWGKQIAEITAPDESWDGKIGSSDASDGTYFYIIKAKGLDDVDYDLKGTVTLIR